MNQTTETADGPRQRELLRCGIQLIYQAFDLNRQLHELSFQGRDLEARLARTAGTGQAEQELAWQRDMVAHLQAELRRQHEELIGFSDRLLMQIAGDQAEARPVAA
jgi:hypothetical protein